jgi:hypothetical protein
MPKNPVRAARQAGRQAVRTAKVANRQDARAVKTTAKVEKIANRTASKVAKIKAAAPKRAAEAPMEKMEAKGMTKISSPKSSGPTKSTPRSMSEVAKGMKPAKKSGSSKAPTPKQAAKTVMGAAKKTADKVKQVVKGSGSSNTGSTGKKGLADGKMSKNALDYSAREIAEGIKNTGKTVGDAAYNKAKGVVDDVYNAAKRKAGYASDAFDAGYNFLFKEKGGAVKKKKYQMGGKVDPYTTKPTATAPMYKRSGTTLTKNADGTYSKKKMGGAMKGKKC